LEGSQSGERSRFRGTIIVGKNPLWKQETGMGKHNNQNSLPFLMQGFWNYYESEAGNDNFSSSRRSELREGKRRHLLTRRMNFTICG
jgi:hypothetical protein